MIESGIYKITNTCNGKFYIGSAVNLSRREWEHFYTLKNGTHHNKHLQSAYNKYGEENFKFEVIECVEDINKLLEREQYWIDNLEACNDIVGYNIRPTAGSNFGYKHTEESKLKISQSNKGKAGSNKGKPCSQKTKDKIGESNRGRKMTENTKKILEEYHNKMVKNLTTGEIFKNIKEAGACYHVSVSGISRVCHGKQGHARKCKWLFL